MPALTFTRSRQTHDATTDRTVAVETEVSGYGIFVRPSLQRYEALGLSLTTTPTLLIVPEDYSLQAFSSDFVQPGDKVTTGGKTYTVKDVDPIAPDGFVIAARVAVAA